MRTLLTRSALLGALAFLPLTRTETASSQATDVTVAQVYDDPRLVQWSRDFIRGNRAAVIAAVEQDLRSPSPHPFAPEIWTLVKERQGVLRHDWQALADPVLRQALGVFPDIYISRYLVYSPQGEAEILNRLPARVAPTIRDPNALSALYGAAVNRRRFDDAAAYVSAALGLDVEAFFIAEDAGGLVSDYRPLVPPTFLATVQNSSSPLARNAVYALRAGELGDLQTLALIDEWLAKHPSDASAFRRRGHILTAMGRIEEALPSFARAYELYPFYTSAADDYAGALLRTNRAPEARTLLERAGIEHAPDSAAAARYTQVHLVQVLNVIGERGEARRVLAEALRRWPGDPDLLHVLVSIELASERPAFAAGYAGEAVRARPDNYWDHLSWLEALHRAGKLGEAQHLAAAMDSAFPIKTEQYYYLAGEVMKDLGAVDQAIAYYRRAVREFPNSSWMAGNLAYFVFQGGGHTDALQLLTNSFQWHSPTTWDVARIREWSDSISGPAATERTLADLRERFPASVPLWADHASHLESPDSVGARAAVWEEAIRRNPGRMWPWEEFISVLVHAKQWNEAERAAQSAFVATRDGTRDDRESAWYYLAYVPSQHALAERIPESVLMDGLARTDSLWNAGGASHAVHRFRSNLLAGLGRERDAAEEFVLASRSAPDDGELAENVVIKYGGTLGGGRAMRELMRYVARDPYDGGRLAALMHKQVMWYINPVEALRTAALIHERAPDHARPEWEAMAWGKLGQAAKAFTVQYGQASSIGSSQRYVAWYDTARLRAQETAATPDEVSFDTATGVATIVRSTGVIEKRADHPLSGKPTLRQLGTAWVRAEYDSLGDNLVRVRASNGREIRLSYNTETRIDTIRSFLDGALESVMSLAYNAHGKPTLIGISGVGQISVTYDAHDSILSVHSDAGRSVAERVTGTFQELLRLLRGFTESSGSLPDLARRDPVLDSLRTSLEHARQSTQGTMSGHPVLWRSALALGRYLTAHAADSPSNAEEAERLLTELSDWAIRNDDDPSAAGVGIAAASAWYDLTRATRQGALDDEGWQRWAALIAWLQSPRVTHGGAAAQALQLGRRIAAQPLVLTKGAQWLPRSYLNNPGYWRRFPVSDLVPEQWRTGAHLNAVLIRRNRDVVVGTDKGLVVRQNGFWRWLWFDESRGVFSANMASAAVEASSNVLALCEDNTGDLWIGTANGLIRIRGDYGDPAQRWQTPADGLPSPRIERLANAGGALLIGTPSGLRVMRHETIVAPPDLAAAPITFLHEEVDGAGVPTEQAEGALVLVGTPTGIFSWSGGALVKVTDGNYADALWFRDEEELFLLHGARVFRGAWAGRGSAQIPDAPLAPQGIQVAQQVYGLASLPLDDGRPNLAVLTDLGISVFKDFHFEHVDVPQLLVDRRVGVHALASRGDRVYALTQDGAFAIERGQVLTDETGPVYDLLTPKGWGVTFISRGDRLDAVNHSRTASGPQPFAYLASTNLATDSLGRLITNDGLRIVRYDRGSTVPQLLFVAEQTTEQDWAGGHVTSILASRDGSIWVTAGPSLFHWKEGATAEEFNMVVDASRFPSRSEMISRVVETVDGRIWAVASDESHLFHHGVRLDGGLLEYDPSANAFHQLADVAHERTTPWRSDTPWFLSSYTAVDSVTGIAGSAEGFALHRGSRFGSLSQLNDESYLALSGRTPLLWLGTRGVSLGDGVWLFGAAGGVIGYRDGQWFYPDRLNRLLPDDQVLGQYGARSVHAVETDSAHRVYVGTDRGLIVYDPDGGDAMEFLVTMHPDRHDAFRVFEQQKLRLEADILLSQIDPKSPVGQEVQRIRGEQQEIDQLRDALSPANRLVPVTAVHTRGGDSLATSSSSASMDDVRSRLADKERAHAQRLAQLERDNLGLFQLLQLNPLDLLAERARLAPDQAVVQYLPTERILYIQVITRDGEPVIREVEVPRDTLFAHARRAALLLASSTRTVPREELLRQLGWLYEQLLRPIDLDVANRSHLFIVPTGPLLYLPFGALVRSQQPSVDYAISRHSFGYLPSMYLLSLVLQPHNSTSQDALVMADPENDLASARAEADTVYRLLGTPTPEQIGVNATYEHLVQYAPSARVLHLATHGFLNEQHPGDSYLSLANGRRLTVVDAMLLDLGQTDLAVLSACQSGLGGDGLEYATLARAFAHARVPTVVATLWNVADVPSALLMRSFYQNLENGDDVFVGLAKAQRAFSVGAVGGGDFTDPRYWAGYLTFGRPAVINLHHTVGGQ